MNPESIEQTPKKKRTAFVQPEQTVTVPAEEFALCGVDFKAESEAGLVASLREAMENARWSDSAKRFLINAVAIGEKDLVTQKRAVEPYCHLPRCIE